MNLGLLGCGKMGGALLRGILRADRSPFSSVHAHDVYRPAVEALRADFPEIIEAASNLAAAKECDVLLLCVKPADTPALAREIAASPRPALCLSVAAGVPIGALEPLLAEKQRLIRVMPNTPALVGAGASAYSLGERATEEDAALAGRILGSVGLAHRVPESLLDAVTGLSGSGPAFIYLVIEALADAGVFNGLPRAQAQELAAQTVLGAAKMVLDTGLHPGALKDQVTSPGGTTIRGVASLEADGLRSAMIRAVNAAVARSKEMSASA